MKPHPHAPWRSAFGDFKAPGRASAKPAADRAAMPLGASSPLRVVAPSAQSQWPRQPLHLASSSHRDRSVPRSVPEASRERGVTPARRRRPSPSLWHTSGRPPRMGDGRGEFTGGFGSGDKLASPVMVALVATIHVFAPERPSERHFAGWRRPCAPQGVDARDKPEHDGEGNRDVLFPSPEWEKVARSAG